MKKSAVLALCLALAVGAAHAFDTMDRGKDCGSCHTLTREEATKLLSGRVEKVIDVTRSEIPGLWTVAVETRGRKVPLYIDFSKKFLVWGNILDLGTMENLTEALAVALNRVDVSKIPLDDAVILGKPNAPHKIIIFDDPECPYCVKLHGEVKRLLQKREDIVFYVKMFPLAIHPSAKEKAKAIVCEKSAQLLEDSFAGKSLPKAKCETDQIEKNVKLAESLGIGSTPTLVFPDGRVFPGFKSAEKIEELLDSKKGKGRK